MVRVWFKMRTQAVERVWFIIRIREAVRAVVVIVLLVSGVGVVVRWRIHTVLRPHAAADVSVPDLRMNQVRLLAHAAQFVLRAAPPCLTKCLTW